MAVAWHLLALCPLGPGPRQLGPGNSWLGSPGQGFGVTAEGPSGIAVTLWGQPLRPLEVALFPGLQGWGRPQAATQHRKLLASRGGRGGCSLLSLGEEMGS